MGFESPLGVLPPLLHCNFFFFLTSLLILTASEASMPLCLSNQSSALLQFKSGISTLFFMELSSWKEGTDCCHWEGVTCHRDIGFVIGLQIPGVSALDSINSSPLDPSLFGLSHLRVLDLRNNGFNGVIPKRLVELSHLTHLDLSSCLFSGAVPLEISKLTRLVYLDLSDQIDLDLQLGSINFTNLVKRLGRLQHLALDWVDISMSGQSVSAIISSSLPGLEMLSLAGSGISGTLDESILQVHSLSHIDLSRNKLSYIPDFFQNFTSLRVLKLANCHNLVSFPSSIFHLPKLETLDLSDGIDLVLSLPSVLTNSSIQYLDLSSVNKLDGVLAVLSTLPRLSHLKLAECRISGDMPLTWASNRIVEMDLTFNHLKGSIPKDFCLSHNLTILRLPFNFLSGIIPSCLFNVSSLEEIDLRQNLLSGIHASIFNLPNLWALSLNDNQLTGEITTTTVNLPSLTELSLSNNMLTGSFPSSLLNLPSLEVLNLENNKFNGSLPSFFNPRSQLTILDLGENCFSGVIPSSISTLSALREANFSSNHFNGTIDLFLFLSLQKLQTLDLSNNKQLAGFESSHSSYSHDGPLGLSLLMDLLLSSCNTKGFPQRFLHKLKHLKILDLSDNGIGGKIPSWLWEIPSLQVLILNHNKIGGFEEVVNRSSLQDSQIRTLSAQSNHITGEIPAFICNLTSLTVLDLSNNGLTGTITDCLGNIPFLTVMNLANNQLQGQIPRFVQATFILVINLSNNLLSGKIDMEAFQNCKRLQVLDLGNNQLNDTFPFWLSSFDQLQVLFLRYNHLYGPITLSGSGEAFPSLHIIDVSNNQFSGSLPHKLFESLQAMMANQSAVRGSDYYWWLFYNPVNLSAGSSSSVGELAFLKKYTMKQMVLTYKGKTMLLPKVMKTLAIIDLSINMFTDKIPDEMGMLKNLVILNISNNNLSGMIPKSLGNSQKMEALDLSHNHLSGVIPVEISALSFLAVLNLSYNDLHGSIPQGQQFGTFDESSFEGNPGLCGTQVQRPCPSGIDDHGGSQKEGPKEAKQWAYGALGVGFAVGLTMTTLLILLVERFSHWYWNIIDSSAEFLMEVFLCKAFKRFGHARH